MPLLILSALSSVVPSIASLLVARSRRLGPAFGPLWAAVKSFQTLLRVCSRAFVVFSFLPKDPFSCETPDATKAS